MKVVLSGFANGRFSPTQEMGDLLKYCDPDSGQTAVTLMVEHPAGTVLRGSNEPDLANKWVDVPGSTRVGQISIPLSTEAISRIRRIGEGEEYEFELTDVEFEEVNSKSQ